MTEDCVQYPKGYVFHVRTLKDSNCFDVEYNGSHPVLDQLDPLRNCYELGLFDEQQSEMEMEIDLPISKSSFDVLCSTTPEYLTIYEQLKQACDEKSNLLPEWLELVLWGGLEKVAPFIGRAILSLILGHPRYRFRIIDLGSALTESHWWLVFQYLDMNHGRLNDHTFLYGVFTQHAGWMSCIVRLSKLHHSLLHSKFALKLLKTHGSLLGLPFVDLHPFHGETYGDLLPEMFRAVSHVTFCSGDGFIWKELNKLPIDREVKATIDYNSDFTLPDVIAPAITEVTCKKFGSIDELFGRNPFDKLFPQLHRVFPNLICYNTKKHLLLVVPPDRIPLRGSLRFPPKLRSIEAQFPPLKRSEIVSLPDTVTHLTLSYYEYVNPLLVLTIKGTGLRKVDLVRGNTPVHVPEGCIVTVCNQP